MLSNMQQKIYDYNASSFDELRYPPSVREIGEAVGLKSPSTVHFHLNKLADLGVFEIGAGKGRAISLTHPAPAAPEIDETPAGKVPIVGNVAAGSPILAQECIEDYLTFDTGRLGDPHFALRVRGASMLNAGILTCNQGESVVAMIDDEATVKRFSRKGGHVWLLPENDAYSPIDGTYAQILGKVVAVVRQY